MADEGAEQCGFCSPGFIMNVLAMARELQNPTLDEIKEYLAGNLCRCTGYMGQLRAIKKYIEVKNAEKKGGKGGVDMAEGQNVCSENKEIRETMRQMRVVNKGIRKVDAKALVTGRAVYTNDIASSDSLIVKLVRSPHAHALIKEINTTRAEASPGN